MTLAARYENAHSGAPAEPARLVLVRHGASAHVRTWERLDRTGVQRWVAAYDRAGIVDTSHPPASLVDVAASAASILCSDLPRAIASAERLARGRSVERSALLRETPLPIPNVRARLPLRVWEGVMHVHWAYAILRGSDASDAERGRAVAAAAWLNSVVDHSTTVVVTHGVFRRLLASQLTALGWKAEERRGGYDHWSAWSLRRPDTHWLAFP